MGPGQVSGSNRWYTGIGHYQWLVLAIASLGWVFDVFEGQIFVASMNEAMPELLVRGSSPGEVAFYNNVAFAAFLAGGAAGGVLFGRLSDRIGRARTLIYTILVYCLCTGLSVLSQTWWQLTVFRFLVALGVGGEWAVATALVAEVFPRKARAWSLAIFHASSVLGTLLAITAGVLVVGNPALGWRWAFVLGTAPALLVIWIRRSLMGKEKGAVPEAAPKLHPTEAWWQLFRAPLLGNSLVGVGLATVGLATFWGTHIYGKDRLRRAVEVEEWQRTVSLPAGAERQEHEQQLAVRLKRWEMAGMFLVTCGGGLGLVAFGPLAERFGRRGAFLIFHVGGLASALLLFLALSGRVAVLLFLPVFGFLTLGMHAGYAVYFPELFPTALRSTGAGFCFNVARLLAAPILLVSGWLQKQGQWGLSLEKTAALLSLLFLAGIALLAAAPETRGRELPD